MMIGELFAGYGGLGLGVESALDQLGITAERAWVAEFDAAPSRILAEHWPDAPNLGDVSKVDFSSVERVDILTRGFPCQDVSLAGRRAGMTEGTRSGLWAEMARAIDEIRPGLIVIENVRGLLSAHAGRPTNDADVESCPICMGDAAGDDLRALGAVLGDLAGLGFDAEWGVLEAASVGAPHRRARVFIVAWPADPQGIARSVIDGDSEEAAAADGDLQREQRREPSAQETGPDECHGSAHPGRGGRALMPTPEAALAARGGAQDPAKRRAGGHSVSLADAVHGLLPTPTACEHTGPGHASQGAPNLRTVASLLPTPSVADVQGGRKHRSGERSGELLLNGLAHHDAFGAYAEAVARWELATGRPAPNPTEPSTSGGRRLSPRFVEWMMGLPEGHVVGRGLTRTEELRALGNGVVPQQACAAVIELLRRAAA